ncbi:hypothetical protein EU528_05395 [Candidatus Thorarchaeota archaeon]|nr:MAG: hypothetical protein EU528_05395 [Candidatus Thorarchaeota archaeon]
MESSDLAHWLLRNAGPSIRFRILVDILNEQDVGVVGKSLSEMLRSPEVTKWVGYLTPKLDFNSIHSSRIDAFENVMGKLVELGLRAGLQPFDSKTLPFRVWLSENVGTPPERPHTIFLRTVVASFLAYAGYDSTDPVNRQMMERLESLYEFARDPDFSRIFVDRAEYKGIPKNSEYDLVNPELYPNQRFMLPWVHDIRGLASCKSIMDSKEHRYKLDKIVRLILSEEYQNLPWSYGLAKYGSRYYVLGWAVHLPGHSKAPEGREFAELLLTLEFISKFRIACESDWFRRSMDYIESFRTDRETYIFPRGWLPEKRTGYWVGGTRMMFDERKGNPTAIECESTFHVLRIRQAMKEK